MTDLKTILSWFQTGDFPTEEEFQQTFSSFRHKETKIPIAEVDNLESSLNNKANIGDIPDNVALVDEGQPANVFNKEQVIAMAMMLSDYVKDGKIRADKIESLGLTDLIEADEKTLSEFVSRSNNYNFQQNDFIAIPVNGNFSLFMFKGGDKKIKENYLPTGLTNITTSMVEGLQDALNKKLEKPIVDGNYFVNMSGNPTYKAINPGENHLLFWDGSNFKNSSIFRENGGLKFGIGTNTPNEQLHLTDRARMKGLVLEDNSEALPQQVTYNNKKFYGTDITGLKRRLMFSDYDDFLLLVNSLTDAQKNAWKTAMNGGWTTNTMSVAIVSPLVVDKSSNVNTWISLKGANLNLNPAAFKIEIMDEAGTAVIAELPNSNIQIYQNGLDLSFYFNFSTLPKDNYRLRIWNGVAYYMTNSNLAIRVIDNVVAIDTSMITWEVHGVPENINSFTTGSGSFAKIRDEVDSTTNITTPVINIKSSPLHDVGDNFYLELDLNSTHGTAIGNTLNSLVPARVGLTYSNFNINLDVFNTTAFLAYRPYSGKTFANINNTNSFVALNQNDVNPSTFSTKLIFIKNGNILYTIWSFNNTVYQLDIDNSRTFSLIAQLPSWQFGLSNTLDMVISKAYKF